MPRKLFHEIYDQHVPLSLAGEHFLRRWHLRALAYLLLAAMAGYAVVVEHNNATHQRQALTASTRQAISAACDADNDTRFVLRTILEENYPQVKAQEQSGRLSHSEADNARRLIKKDI